MNLLIVDDSILTRKAMSRILEMVDLPIDTVYEAGNGKEALPFADPVNHRAHDAYHRFFPDAHWVMSRLWQQLALILVATLCPKGIITLALDDTLFHHSGQKMEGTGAWRDAVRSTRKKIVYAWGLNLVVLTLQVQSPWGGEPLGLAKPLSLVIRCYSPKQVRNSSTITW